MDDLAVYNGKIVDVRPKMFDLLSGMSHIRTLTTLIFMPRFSTPADISSIPQTQSLSAFLSAATSSTLSFNPTAFGDPFLIAYSSGTTAMPKCIVPSC